MTVRISAVVLLALLTGCVSTTGSNSDNTESTSVPATTPVKPKSAATDFHRNTASAEGVIERTAAGLVGIRVGQVQATAFLVACALSGVAAFAVLSLEGQITPMLGMWMLTKGLVAAMLGGLGSVRGVLLGGWLLGIVEAHAQAAFGAVGREFATYALLFLVLVASPAGRSGLLGRGGWRHAA